MSGNPSDGHMPVDAHVGDGPRPVPVGTLRNVFLESFQQLPTDELSSPYDIPAMSPATLEAFTDSMASLSDGAYGLDDPFSFADFEFAGPRLRPEMGLLTPEPEPAVPWPMLDRPAPCNELPEPLVMPVDEQHPRGEIGPTEAPGIPPAVRPYAGDWWYFPEPVLISATVDWSGQPQLIFRRAPPEIDQPRPDRPYPQFYEHPQHAVAATLGEHSASNACAGACDSCDHAGPATARTAECLGEQQTVAGHGSVTRTVYYEVKVEETEDALALLRDSAD